MMWRARHKPGRRIVSTFESAHVALHKGGVMRIIASVIISAGILASMPVQQTPEPPAFEVASIKPAPPGEPGRVVGRMTADAGRIDYRDISLHELLRAAYKVKRYQVRAPSWTESARYDVRATIPTGASAGQVPFMLQKLIAERFQAALHRETREGPVYALLTAKDGPKLKKAAGDPQPEMLAPGAVRTATTVNPDGVSRLELKAATMSAFAGLLSDVLNRPVVDLTALDGVYDIAIDAGLDEIMGIRRKSPGAAPIGHDPAPGGPQSAAAPDAPPSAALFAAIQRLGLTLEPRRMAVEYIVIDKAEKVPTEN